jgi:DNA-binding CsgD family transcriptional regulator
MTMKLKYPFKTATVEEDTTVTPLPDPPGGSPSPCRSMEGVLPNSDIAATSEVAAWYQSHDARPHESSALQSLDGVSERKDTGSELSPLSKTREAACPRGCRVCFLARKYGLTPREVNLIALISSGQSSRAMSQTLGIRVETIRENCRTIHHKIGTHSRLAIGLWAIRKGMVKGVVEPNSGFPRTGPLERCPAHEIQIAPEKLWP